MNKVTAKKSESTATKNQLKLAELAVAGSPEKMTGAETTKMAEIPTSFFDICGEESLKAFRKIGSSGFNRLILNGGDKYFRLPDQIYDDAFDSFEVKSEKDGEKKNKESKEYSKKKVVDFYTKAMSHLLEQILGMLVPGQVEMIMRLHEVERNSATNMASIGVTLKAVQNKLDFYAEENKKLNATFIESVKAQRDLEAKVESYRQETEKLRQERAFSDHDRDSAPAPTPSGYKGILDPRYTHNMEDNFGLDRKFPGGHDHIKQMKKNEKDNKNRETNNGRPVGARNKDMQSSSNSGVANGYGMGSDLGAGVGPGVDRRPYNHQRSDQQNGARPDDGFSKQRNGRRKRERGKTDPREETERRTNRERISDREIIIHGIESQDPLTYTKEREADLVQDVFEELGVEHLKHFGVDVNLKYDIFSHIRLDRHWEAYPENRSGEEGRGCAPIKVRLMSQKICNLVLKAADKGGCLLGRKAVFIGKHRAQHLKDRAGNNVEQDHEAAAMAAKRPGWHIRPSTTTQRRAELNEAREKRDKEKDDPEKDRWRKENEDNKSKVVFYGIRRNFDNSRADEVNGRMMDEAKARRDAAAAAKLKKDEEKRAKIAERLKAKPEVPNPQDVLSGESGTPEQK